eukprot:CAMPEP_0113824086 /NCGR_PEP_ID=MMETSP0328-20130328/3067_1 /TAXON_ID=39455 /ORGANISM="Alexandrium minutum" /LENGTH=154 /DNA_ID=CAMNT_0000792027 /DNA_START=180 /DNA_END=641 /DNA_ORIENTATION=+ /assembly_acc=CAM_ASM_000350
MSLPFHWDRIPTTPSRRAVENAHVEIARVRHLPQMLVVTGVVDVTGLLRNVDLRLNSFGDLIWADVGASAGRAEIHAVHGKAVLVRLVQEEIVDPLVHRLVRVAILVAVVRWSVGAVWQIEVLALRSGDDMGGVGVVVPGVTVTTILLVDGAPP